MKPVSISNPCKLYNFDVHKNVKNNAVSFSGKNDEISKNSFSSYFYGKRTSEIDKDSRPYIPQMLRININPILYSDMQKFSEYFETKLQKMLDERSEADITNEINEVSKITGADEKTVTEVMTRLTQFSGWSTLGSLEKALQEANCGQPYDLFSTTKDASRDKSRNSSPGYLTLNDVMNYLSSNKKQIKFEKEAPYTLFIDDFETEEIKRVKEFMPECYDNLVKDINAGKVKLAIIDGWNAKSAYSDLSQTMFGSAHNLKTSAVSIIRNMNAYKENLDDALNGDTIKTLKDIFGEDVPYQIIKNPDVTENSAKTISQNTSSLYPKAPEIKAVIETLADNCSIGISGNEEDIKETKALLAKYFDENTICFSQKTISDMMKDKYYKICEINSNYGRDGDDIRYIIPAKGKSFELMTYQFAKVNGIRPSQIVYYNGLYSDEKQFCKYDTDLNDKTLVILDDVIGSGASLSSSEFKYDMFASSRFKNSDIVFSSLAAMRPGIDRLTEKTMFSGRFYDKILPGRISDSPCFSDKDGFKKSKDRQMLEKAIGGCGYYDGWACIAMPYMLPDNNSNAAGMMFSYSLKNNDISANKCSRLYYQFRDELEQRVKADTRRS